MLSIQLLVTALLRDLLRFGDDLLGLQCQFFRTHTNWKRNNDAEPKTSILSQFRPFSSPNAGLIRTDWRYLMMEVRRIVSIACIAPNLHFKSSPLNPPTVQSKL